MTTTIELVSLDSLANEQSVVPNWLRKIIKEHSTEAVAIATKKVLPFGTYLMAVEVVFPDWGEARCDLCGIVDSDTEDGFDAAFGLDAYQLKTGAIQVLCQPCAATYNLPAA